MAKKRRSSGYTLMEVLIVIGLMVGAMALVAPQALKSLSSEKRMLETARQVAADIKALQTEAMKLGGEDITNGRIVYRCAFMVFDANNNTYQGFTFVDLNANNKREDNELTAMAPEKRLPNNVTYGKTAEVTRSGCGSSGPPPASDVSYTVSGKPPCNNKNCMQMDNRGFPASDGTIYLTNGIDSYAVSVNRAGIIRMCKWPKGGIAWLYVR